MKAGQYITDSTAIFILDDVRDGNRVGDIVLKPTLNEGYIKANGAVAIRDLVGAFYGQGNLAEQAESDGTHKELTEYLFDASRSNSIYGSSDTVQPPACCLIAQIKY